MDSPARRFFRTLIYLNTILICAACRVLILTALRVFLNISKILLSLHKSACGYIVSFPSFIYFLVSTHFLAVDETTTLFNQAIQISSVTLRSTTFFFAFSSDTKLENSCNCQEIHISPISFNENVLPFTRVFAVTRKFTCEHIVVASLWHAHKTPSNKKFKKPAVSKRSTRIFWASTESFLKLPDFVYSAFLTTIGIFMFTTCSLVNISKEDLSNSLQCLDIKFKHLSSDMIQETSENIVKICEGFPLSK